jgi:Ni,Fe-hydrogenase III component G
MLSSISEDPVIDIENLPPSGNTALTLLRSVTRDLQEEQAWFNTEIDVSLLPDVLTGYIYLPANTLSVDSDDLDVIERDGLLYNKDDKTFIFSAAVSCEITYRLTWDEIPSVARRYYTALAIERLVETTPGADPTSASRQRNLLRAKVAFERAKLRNGDYNLLNNTSIQSTLRRT